MKRITRQVNTAVVQVQVYGALSAVRFITSPLKRELIRDAHNVPPLGPALGLRTTVLKAV
jgi:hypothetical protein